MLIQLLNEPTNPDELTNPIDTLHILGKKTGMATSCCTEQLSLWSLHLAFRTDTTHRKRKFDLEPRNFYLIVNKLFSTERLRNWATICIRA